MSTKITVQSEVMEKVTKCIRAMKKEPSALLFIENTPGCEDWTFDGDDILGIPVYHADGLSCTRWGTDVDDCPFVPLGVDDSEINMNDRKSFSAAWN